MPALAEVEARVRPAALRAKAGELALARLTQARGALASGRTLDEVAKELAVEVKESGEFGRDGNIEGLADSRAARLRGPRGQGRRRRHAGRSPTRAPSSSRSPRARASTPPPSPPSAPRRGETLERNEVNRLLGSIIEQRKREAKVQYDKPLLEQFGMLGDEAKGT